MGTLAHRGPGRPPAPHCWGRGGWPLAPLGGAPCPLRRRAATRWSARARPTAGWVRAHPATPATLRSGAKVALPAAAGWYHSKQLLAGEIPGAALTDVVEPWFLGDGAGTPGSEDFAAWRAEAEAAGVRFWPSVSHLRGRASR